MKITEWQSWPKLNSLIDELSLSGYFEDNFTLDEWKYDNWSTYIEIRWKNGDGYLRCTILWEKSWYLDTIYSPKNGTFLLLALFYYGSEYYKISNIEGNARTNDELLNSQEQLEDWYRKFGFEVISRDTNGARMRANVKNRPLAFRFDLLHRKIKKRTNDTLHATQSPPSASNHPQDPRSPSTQGYPPHEPLDHSRALSDAEA